MNIRRTGTLRAVLALAALTSALAACSSSKPSASAAPATLTTVNVGVTGATAPPTFLVLVADKLGIAARNGFKVNYVTLSPNVTAQALAKGSVDVLAAPSVETAILSGAPLKIFAGAALSYWAFYAGSGITSWSDLAGKRIGLPCGQAATCHSFMTDVLASHGVDASSVTFVYGTAQGNYESLAAGAVDAALTTAPYTYALASAGKTHSISLSGTAPYLSTQFTATTGYIAAHPKVIQEFATAMSQSEAALAKLPVSSNILTIIDQFESQNGINPATLDQGRFLTEFANDHSWQIVPTRSLITEDLKLLAAIPSFHAEASKASFSDLVYSLPQFSSQYG